MLRLIFVLSLICHSALAYAEKPQWELGAGITGINLPLYPGSSQSKNYLIPFPYFRFTSKYLEVDDGIRAFLLQSPNLRFNISADLGVPVNSDDSKLRMDMPDLNTVIQIGPSLEYIFSGSRSEPYEFRFELPLRTAIATDLKSTQNVGWILEPRITFETLRPFKNGYAYQVSTGLRYSTKEYHQYYYDVPAAFVTAERPLFESDGGYSGYFMDLIGNWRHDDLIYFTFIRYQNLSGTAFEDSPLVDDTNYFSVGLGLVWMIAGSK